MPTFKKIFLSDIASDLRSKLGKNGLVILSGLLVEDEEDIINHYSKLDFSFIQKEKMDEWIALVFEVSK